MRQAAIVTSEERRGVDFTFGGGKIILAGHGAELGESHVELPIAYDGADVGITLDPRFLSDFLKVLDPEQTFAMELRNAESAAVVQHRRRLRLRDHAVGPRAIGIAIVLFTLRVKSVQCRLCRPQHVVVR